MALLPVTLGVRQRPSAGGAAGKQPRTNEESFDREDVLRRDNYTCRCCGFHSREFQRVIPWDQTLQKADSHVTVCPFCEMCLSLEHAGIVGGGVLVWLPEMSQAELHHIVRAIYVARSQDGAMGESATRALEILLGRRTEAKKRLGSDDPLLLATVLIEKTTADDYAARVEKLDGIRFLPLDRWLVHTPGGDRDLFPSMIKYWTSPEGPFHGFSSDTWGEKLSELSNEAASSKT